MKTYKFYKIFLVMFFAGIIFNRTSFAVVLSLRSGWFNMPADFSSDSYRILSGTFYARIHTDKHALKTGTEKGSYKCVEKSCFSCCLRQFCVCAKKQRDVYNIYKDEKDEGFLSVGDTYLYYETPYYSEEKKKEERQDDKKLGVPYYSQYYDKIEGYAGDWKDATWLTRNTLNILETKKKIYLYVHRRSGDYPRISSAYLNLNIEKLPPPPPPQEPKKDIVPEPQNFLMFLLGTLVFLFPQNISRFR